MTLDETRREAKALSFLIRETLERDASTREFDLPKHLKPSLITLAASLEAFEKTGKLPENKWSLIMPGKMAFTLLHEFADESTHPLLTESDREFLQVDVALRGQKLMHALGDTPQTGAVVTSVARYAKERQKDDILPRSMKALVPHLAEYWAGLLQEERKQKQFAESGSFVLLAKRSAVTRMEARDELCLDCVEWFNKHGLIVKPTHCEFDETSEDYKEITFKVSKPEEKATQLADLLKTLAEELNEQAAIDKHFVSRAV